MKERVATISVWVLKVLLALIFAAAALAKLAGQPMMVTEFGAVGLGQGFRYLVALIEIAGVVLVLVPKTAFYGALTLFAVCVGALVADLTRIHGDLVHIFVLGALTGLLAWLTRPARGVLA